MTKGVPRIVGRSFCVLPEAFPTLSITIKSDGKIVIVVANPIIIVSIHYHKTLTSGVNVIPK